MRRETEREKARADSSMPDWKELLRVDGGGFEAEEGKEKRVNLREREREYVERSRKPKFPGMEWPDLWTILDCYRFFVVVSLSSNPRQGL